MALYAIGDLHLSQSGDKPMDVFGEVWKDHAEKLKTGFSTLNEDDVTVLCGDLSWAMDLQGALEDFRFIDSLPGKKLLLKGNHDYWWSTAAKTGAFFQANGLRSMELLHNNCFLYGDTALCGTRGWFYEEERSVEHDRKILRREVMRLEASLTAAGDHEKLVFLHYPPVYRNYECPEILDLLSRYRVRLCCYGHLHGKSRLGAFCGWRGCTEFRLVSADHVGFAPVRLADGPGLRA